MNSNELVLLYVPLPDQKTGQMMAQRLLEKKLIACANVFPPHIAIYDWNGAICDDPETLVLFKTTEDKKKAATEMIVDLHPYSTPCITTLPTNSTHGPFLDWVRRQTEGEPAPSESNGRR